MAAVQRLMIGHVRFTVKATNDQRQVLRATAEQAGIEWHEMLRIVEGAVSEACRAAADAAVAEIVRHWGTEEWLEGKRRFL